MNTGYPRRDAGGWAFAVVAVLVAVTELIILAACFYVLYTALMTNGQVFTETDEHTRALTWWTVAIVAVTAAAVPLLCAAAYAIARPGPVSYLAVAAPALLLVVVIAVLAGFHRFIPVPPGTHSGRFPAP